MTPNPYVKRDHISTSTCRPLNLRLTPSEQDTTLHPASN